MTTSVELLWDEKCLVRHVFHVLAKVCGKMILKRKKKKDSTMSW